jgi:SAM-dependent methyltransferase
MTIPPDWLSLNLANWNERVPLHLNATGPHYKLTALKAGTARLDPIASSILGPIEGMRVLHLQCHFGVDSLTLAQQGGIVAGLDFSPPAIEAARALAGELGLAEGVRFVQANIYDAEAAIGEPAAFDRVFVSWGALCWLPDIFGWARIVASFLKPGGFLALADAHPFAYVFDDLTATADGKPGWYAPYLDRLPLLEDRPQDYADPDARLRNSRTVEFIHPLGDVVSALIEAGLRIESLHEHDSIVWQMFAGLRQRTPGEYVWPDRPWLPLSYSLRASKS